MREPACLALLALALPALGCIEDRLQVDVTTYVRFRVTLVMPAAITRANACVQGDTAVWEFDQDDLYGRGFEMWARAGGR